MQVVEVVVRLQQVRLELIQEQEEPAEQELHKVLAEVI
tara:strand:- start:249 stop:362 length:114 start_codon:yes stop_codon:yes gene_type:complete